MNQMVWAAILVILPGSSFAQHSKPSASPIKYLLWKGKPYYEQPNRCRGGKPVSLSILSEESKVVYCPVDAKVINTFSIKGIHTLVLQLNRRTFLAVSELDSIPYLKGALIKAGSRIGMAKLQPGDSQPGISCMIFSRKKFLTPSEIERYLQRLD